MQHKAKLTKRQVDDNVIEAEVRRKIALSVREMRRSNSLAVKLCVSNELNDGSKRVSYPLAGVDGRCTASNIRGSTRVRSFPEPNIDVVICALHSIPMGENVSHE
jgi:hypothetical protein